MQVSGSYNVTFGYSGPFTATARGLVPAAVTPGTVADDPTDSTCSLTSPNAQLIPVTIPAGTTYARYSLFDADVNAGSDLDMCVFQGTTLVGSSGTGTSAEEVNFSFASPSAAPIALTVVVQGWGVVGSTPFKLHSWYLGTANAGNMTVTAPAAATIGGTGAINLSFSGLDRGYEVPRLGRLRRRRRAAQPDDRARRSVRIYSQVESVSTDAPGRNPRGVFFGAREMG